MNIDMNIDIDIDAVCYLTSYCPRLLFQHSAGPLYPGLSLEIAAS